MEESKSILISAKFTSLMLHIVATTMLFFTYEDNILTTFPTITSRSDSDYKGGQASFLAANLLTLICLSTQIIILFIGINLFKQKHAFLVSNLHLMGAILYSAYGFQLWQISTIWALWAATSLFPLFVEILGAILHPKK